MEYNSEVAEFALRNVERVGFENLVSTITGGTFVEDFSKATVVTMYLLPRLNVKLRPTTLAMKPSVRVTAHRFDMGDREADQRPRVEQRDGLVWIVPASVGGEWALKGERRSLAGTLNPMRRRQRVGGTLFDIPKTPITGSKC